MFRFLLPLLCMITFSSAAYSQTAETRITISSPEDYAHTIWQGMPIPAGTVLVTEHAGERQGLHRLEFEGGVVMHEMTNGEYTSVDTKHGAVGCIWLIYASMKAELDACFPAETDLRNAFTTIVDELKQFIIANSITPITQGELDAFLVTRTKSYNGKCKERTPDEMQQFISESKEHIDKHQQKIKDSLSIPRPPVTNPCL